MKAELNTTERRLPMTNIFQTSNKKPGFLKTWMLYIVGGVLLGSIATNRVDDFFNNHVITYQSPIVLQAPMLVKSKLESPVPVIATAVATPAAVLATPTPTVEPIVKKQPLLP